MASGLSTYDMFLINCPRILRETFYKRVQVMELIPQDLNSYFVEYLAGPYEGNQSRVGSVDANGMKNFWD